MLSLGLGEFTVYLTRPVLTKKVMRTGEYLVPGTESHTPTLSPLPTWSFLRQDFTIIAQFALDSWSFCLRHSSAGITGVHHCFQSTGLLFPTVREEEVVQLRIIPEFVFVLIPPLSWISASSSLPFYFPELGDMLPRSHQPGLCVLSSYCPVTALCSWLHSGKVQSIPMVLTSSVSIPIRFSSHDNGLHPLLH